MVSDRCRSASHGTVDVVVVAARCRPASRRHVSVMCSDRRRDRYSLRGVMATRPVLQVPRGREFPTTSAPAAARRCVHSASGTSAPRTFPTPTWHLRHGCSCNIGSLCVACVPWAFDLALGNITSSLW